jgi:hypothetical protein
MVIRDSSTTETSHVRTRGGERPPKGGRRKIKEDSVDRDGNERKNAHWNALIDKQKNMMPRRCVTTMRRGRDKSSVLH